MVELQARWRDKLAGGPQDRKLGILPLATVMGVGRPRRIWLESVEANMAELEIDKEDSMTEINGGGLSVLLYKTVIPNLFINAESYNIF